METSRVLTITGLFLTFVACVAALLVVPEVRCQLGLNSDASVRCVENSFVGGGGSASSSGSRATDSGVETQILHIRQVYRRTEDDRVAGLLDDSRKEITGIPGDSAYATIYRRGGEVAKVRARVYRGDQRISMEAFYERGELLFIHRTVNRLFPGGSSDLGQQRFYFGGGRMIRWLKERNEPASPASAEFGRRGGEVAEFGATLLAGSGTADPVIRF